MMNKMTPVALRSIVTAAFYMLLAPATAFAAAGGHGEAHGIPSFVMWQAINFTLFALLMFFFLRKPVVNYFRGREESFKSALVKAEAARKEAEQRRNEIKRKIEQIESTAEQSIANARAEAQALREKITQEAAELSRNLKDEAHQAAQHEVVRATNQLRDELLSQAMTLSKQLLADKMAEPDQKRLQTEFVDKIEVV